jgi:predicted lactoylglutathione lyase
MSSPTSTFPNLRQAVPFFWVNDMEASRSFYVHGLGFTMTNSWVDDGVLRWCWLERGGSALMLQSFWREGHHRNLPTTPVGVGVSICFVCDDAIALYHELTSRGLAMSRPMVGNGMWVTQIADPDGYRLYFESYTDAPETSAFAEQVDVPRS